ncbi:MAG: hypothetical protein PHY93_06880 [Bacteriovorax sp.]|nr:hypothetical protein [Bacteriovorax sp.]
MNWNKEIFNQMAAVASRSPSVHNVQPWKVQFTEDGFNLYQAKSRRLFVGDPKLHDNDVSLGCFFELCRMFLHAHGLGSTIVKDDTQKSQDFEDSYEMRFKITLSPISPVQDRLYDNISKRRSFRGIFQYDKHFDENKLKEIKVDGLELKWICERDELNKWAGLYDESSSQINQGSGYFKELIHWIRFSQSDPKFLQDGLNYKALALGKMEAIMAGLLFKESIFKLLSKLSLEKILITEAPQIRSSQGILIVYANNKLGPFEMGVAFMRLWLELTSKELYACPLSALVDFTHTGNILNSMKPSNDMICLNVLRFGKVADEKNIYSSPRLGIDRIIIP